MSAYSCTRPVLPEPKHCYAAAITPSYRNVTVTLILLLVLRNVNLYGSRILRKHLTRAPLGVSVAA